MKRHDPLATPPAKIARAHRWGIGTPVSVTRDNGDVLRTVTRSAPWQVGKTWVILVEGISGCYALTRVCDDLEVAAAQAAPAAVAIPDRVRTFRSGLSNDPADGEDCCLSALPKAPTP